MKYGLLLLTLLLSACAQEYSSIPGPSTRTEVIVHHPVGGKLYVDEDAC